jgi:hypothetical protein
MAAVIGLPGEGAGAGELRSPRSALANTGMLAGHGGRALGYLTVGGSFTGRCSPLNVFIGRIRGPGIVDNGRASRLAVSPRARRARERTMHAGVLSLFAAMLAASVAGAQTTPPCLVLAGVDTTVAVFAVADSGRVERLPFRFARHRYGCVGEGDSGPILSPDRRHVAFVRDRDLLLLDLRTNSQRTVTSVPNGPSVRGGSQPYITQWSSDGRRLLYCIGSSGPHASFAGPRAEGFYVFEVATGLSTPIALPSEFVCWLPSGEFVLSLWRPSEAGESGVNGELALYRFNAADSIGPVRLTPPCNGHLAYCYTQVVANSAGSRLAMVYWPSPDSLNRIVECDLATGTLLPVPALGSCDDCQRPSYSPSGEHLAVLDYPLRGKRNRATDEDTTVLVDGRAIATCHGMMGSDAISWVSDSTMVVTCQDSVQVVNVNNGQPIGAAVHVW